MLKHGPFHPASRFAYLNTYACKEDIETVTLPAAPESCRRVSKTCPRKDLCPFKHSKYGCREGRLCERTISYTEGSTSLELSEESVGPLPKRIAHGFYDGVWNVPAEKPMFCEEEKKQDQEESARLERSIDIGFAAAEEDMQSDHWRWRVLLDQTASCSSSSSE